MSLVFIEIADISVILLSDELNWLFLWPVFFGLAFWNDTKQI